MSAHCLVADDSLYARLVLKNAIQEILPDAQFTEAKSGEQVLELALAPGTVYDWYLLDVNMAPPDGLVIANRLLLQGVEPRRIALVTGNRSSHLKDETGKLGIVLVNKAISPDDMESFIERLRVFFGEVVGGHHDAE